MRSEGFKNIVGGDVNVVPQEDDPSVLRARIQDLEAALNQNNYNIQAAFKLSPALSNILGLLLALPAVTSDMIHQRLGLAADAKVAIHRLRLHLKEFTIEVKSRRNIGYWLDADTKARIKQAISDTADALTPSPDISSVEAAA